MSSLAHPAPADRVAAPTAVRGPLRTAAGLALVPAVAGAALAPSRWEAAWSYGALSALTAAVLVALALRLAAGRSDAWTLQATVWGAVALVLAFIVTRTAGIPFGPLRGEVGPVDPLGVATAAASACLVVTLAPLLGGRARSRTLTALVVVAVAVWAVALLGGLAPANPSGKAVGGHGHANPGLPLPYIPDDVREQPRAPAGSERPLPAGG